MAKIKTALAVACILMALQTTAQRGPTAGFVRKTLMSIGAGLGGGIFIHHPVQNIYFNGNFAYCMEDRIGVRTDFYLFVPDAAIDGQLDRNSSFFFGPEFHFPARRLDWTILFQPGLSFSYLKEESSSGKSQAEPLLSLTSGLTYYIFGNFHAGIHVQYVKGNYFYENAEPYNLDEIRFMATLGVNLFVNHQAAYQRKRPRF